MSDEWRSLLYPLGFLASLAYGARFLVQWVASEKKGQPVAPPLFWKLSLVGNGILFIHSLIQLHFPMCLSLSVNAVLFWRNLNLLKPKEEHVVFSTVIRLLILAASMTTLLFLLQSLLLGFPWLSAPWSFGLPRKTSALVHLFGILGIICFAARFWAQWWQAEQQKTSLFPELFWWLSLSGAFLCTIYFSLTHDWVNLFGAVASFVPYGRNLWLLLKKKEKPLPTPSLFIFAGEVSADLYGSQLISKLREKLPHVHLWGVGGPAMRSEGFQIVAPMEAFRVMGFQDVIIHFARLAYQFFTLKRAILKHKPQLILCIDQPSFAMRLAKSLRRSKYQGKIVQFVAPTVWAWKKGRAEKMAKDFDLLLTLFDFEPEHFAHTTLKTVYVGHPMVEIIEKSSASLEMSENNPILAIFPGSRPHEIKRNLPKQLQAALSFQKNFPEMQIAVCALESVQLPEGVVLVPFHKRYELMKKAHFALAKSGTVTLELALHAVPTVVTYELSWLNLMIAGYLLKIRLPFYCIVNILTQKELFFELIRPPVSSEDIEKRLEALQKDVELRSSCKKECLALKARLKTDTTPTEKAANEICAIFQAS